MKKKILLIGLAALLAIFGAGLAPTQVEASASDNADGTGDDVSVITAKQISGDISSDPQDIAWHGAPRTVVSLLAQDVAEPKEFNPSASQVAVQALRNGREIALRLEWVDVSKDTAALRHDDYRDSAAVMFPVNPTGENPPDEVQEILPFMGDDGNMVNIWHWKADWQREGTNEAALKDGTYPNMQADYYINETAGASSVSAEAQADSGTGCSDCVGNPCGSSKKLGYSGGNNAQTLMTGEGDNQGVFDAGQFSNNILSTESMRKSSVEDLNAEGFGTLTTQGSQDVGGYGVHGNDVWKVVVKRNIATSDKHDTQFARFEQYVPVAFAVWDGSHGERNGMKGRSTWHYLKVE